MIVLEDYSHLRITADPDEMPCSATIHLGHLLSLERELFVKTKK